MSTWDEGVRGRTEREARVMRRLARLEVQLEEIRKLLDIRARDEGVAGMDVTGSFRG